MDKDFIIDQVSWHTQKNRNYLFDTTIIYQYFETIIKYLQQEGLTKKSIIDDVTEVDENTCIRSSDLTDEGLLLLQKAYAKWVDRIVDKRQDVSDVKILNNALKVIRNKIPPTKI